jgi:hypothetical protein
MKDAKETLFEHYQQDGEGGLKLTTDDILQAMEEYADEKLTAFMTDYIGRGASRFEIEKMIHEFDDKQPF